MIGTPTARVRVFKIKDVWWTDVRRNPTWVWHCTCGINEVHSTHLEAVERSWRHVISHPVIMGFREAARYFDGP